MKHCIPFAELIYKKAKIKSTLIFTFYRVEKKERARLKTVKFHARTGMIESNRVSFFEKHLGFLFPSPSCHHVWTPSWSSRLWLCEQDPSYTSQRTSDSLLGCACDIWCIEMDRFPHMHTFNNTKSFVIVLYDEHLNIWFGLMILHSLFAGYLFNWDHVPLFLKWYFWSFPTFTHSLPMMNVSDTLCSISCLIYFFFLHACVC